MVVQFSLEGALVLNNMPTLQILYFVKTVFSDFDVTQIEKRSKNI